jgi:hypothetical protein
MAALDHRAADLSSPLGLCQPRTAQQFHAPRRSGAICACIRQRHPRACPGEGRRNGVAFVIAGGQKDPPPGNNAVKPQVMQRCLCRHHAGQVVIGEPQGPFDGTCG